MINLVLGDNPLFGVSHSGKSLSVDQENVYQLVEGAVKIGVKEWMVTPHQALYSSLSFIRERNPSILNELQLQLVFPYPHAWNEIVASGGYIALAKTLPFKDLCHAAIKGTYNLICRRYQYLIMNFYEIFLIREIKKLKLIGVCVSGVCIHNIIVDILLAAGREDVLKSLVEMLNSHNVKPIVLTQNFMSVQKLDLPENTIICSSLNSIGYMVNPNLKEVVHALNDCSYEFWAMQVVASGYSSFEDFYNMIEKCSLPISKIVLGTTLPSRLIDAQSIFS